MLVSDNVMEFLQYVYQSMKTRVVYSVQEIYVDGCSQVHLRTLLNGSLMSGFLSSAR